MPFEITMPQLGLTMEKGTIVEWLVGEGDRIAAGQEILTVETDKSIVAVEARETGRLGRILVPAGQEVAVGTVLAVGVAPGEELPGAFDLPAGRQAVQAASGRALPGTPSHPVTAPPAQTGASRSLEASWKARETAREAGLALGTVAGHGPGGRIVAADVEAALASFRRRGIADLPAAEPALTTQSATPVAAGLAEALGLDLGQVSTRSGPGGRICQEDVLAAAAALIREARRQASFAVAADRPGSPLRQAQDGVVSSIPLKGMRKIVSEGMARSVQATARVTLFREVDAGNLVRWREGAKGRGLELSFNDLLIRICAVALREHPAANARLGEGQIELLDRVHIGLAVDTERGLLVPVVHDADRLSLSRIAVERARLVAAARSGHIGPDDLRGGTFTLTNLGMYGVEGFTPVIHLPECCILGVGRIVRKPVVEGDGDVVAVRPTMTLSLVFDHRILDGAPAARFLDRIARLVEEPVLLLAGEA